MAKQKKKFEFSKLIMVSVMLTYFIVLFVVVGVIAYMILSGNAQYLTNVIATLCSFVGAQVGVAIAFYSWKAKNENTAKIANSNNSSPTPIPLNDENNNI